MSALNDILNAIQARVQTLNLIAPGEISAMPVVIRKLQRAQETEDPSAQITITKSKKPEQVKWLAFASADQPQGTVKVRYLILVAVEWPGNADYLSNIPTLCSEREQIRGLFQKPPLPGASTVIDLDIDPDVFLPEEYLRENWEYQVVGVWVTSIEPGNS